MARTVILLVLLAASACPAPAQQWARKLFDHTSHDLGVVAKGQEVEHRFVLENIYLEPIEIETVTSSCACFLPKIPKGRLETYEKGEIIAVVDTRKFSGRKQTTLRVKLAAVAPDCRMVAEVQLHCYVYIRKDVVVEPGTVSFGSVAHGAGAPAQRVSVSYAGRSDWAIVRAESDNPSLELKLVETGRQAGQVSYDLFVGLKPDAPPGYIRDHVLLATNDERQDAARVVVNVEGQVVPNVSVRPSPLMLGLLKPGQIVERPLIAKGREPFRIVDVTGPGDPFQFKWSDEAKDLHMIGVTYTAGDAPGRITGTIRIVTDVPGSEQLEVNCEGRVLAPETPPGP
jgi:hypothetical protein